MSSSMSVRDLIKVLAATVSIVMFPSCDRLGFGIRKIGDVLADPQKYSSQEIRIRGTVTNVIKVPFVGTKLYSVQDGSGEIIVRSSQYPPLTGSEVRVKGVLETVATLGSQQIGLHLREIERW
jgi:hypothetical protein